VAGADLESLLKTWMPAGVQDGLQGWESVQKAFWAHAAGPRDKAPRKTEVSGLKGSLCYGCHGMHVGAAIDAGRVAG